MPTLRITPFATHRHGQRQISTLGVGEPALLRWPPIDLAPFNSPRSLAAPMHAACVLYGREGNSSSQPHSMCRIDEGEPAIMRWIRLTAFAPRFVDRNRGALSRKASDRDLRMRFPKEQRHTAQRRANNSELA